MFGLQIPPWIYVGITVLGVVYSQSVLKAQLGGAGVVGERGAVRWSSLLGVLLEPWVLSAFVTLAVVAVCWMAALSKYELSTVYPYMALTYVGVLAVSALFLNEPVTLAKVFSVTFIVAGLLIGSLL